MKTYHCPMCGKPMTAQTQEYGHNIPPKTQLDCKNKNCKMCIEYITTTPNAIISGRLAEQWNITYNYDIKGKEIK